jgi:hypothetical protein
MPRQDTGLDHCWKSRGSANTRRANLFMSQKAEEALAGSIPTNSTADLCMDTECG